MENVQLINRSAFNRFLVKPSVLRAADMKFLAPAKEQCMKPAESLLMLKKWLKDPKSLALPRNNNVVLEIEVPRTSGRIWYLFDLSELRLKDNFLGSGGLFKWTLFINLANRLIEQPMFMASSLQYLYSRTPSHPKEQFGWKYITTGWPNTLMIDSKRFYRDQNKPSDNADIAEIGDAGSADTTRMYLRKTGECPLLSREDEIKYASQARAGNIEARNRMITSNLGLVISIVKRYSWKKMPLPDLIQEGCIGLIKAIKKFDLGKRHKFSTYATGWVRQAMTTFIADQARTIRIPVSMLDKIRKIRNATETLRQQLGRFPTVKEVAEKMGMSAAKVREILRISQDTLSLETPLGRDNRDNRLGDFMKDTAQAPDEAVLPRLFLRENLKEAMSSLSDKEKTVLNLRFGLDGGQPKTLEEVGKVFKLTRERIRQIEAEALRRLRHPTRSLKLKDYLY
jgi:RNA polymerase primary sigma factor